jgi:small subunit ribosomal protein S6
LSKDHFLCYTSQLFDYIKEGLILKPYEAILIFHSSYPEDKIDVSIAKFEKKIKDNGGTDIITAKWGMKRLASAMKKSKKSMDGFYVMINFNGEGKTPNELKSLLNVSEEVIRYSVIASRPEQAEVEEEKVEIDPSLTSPTQTTGQGEASA